MKDPHLEHRQMQEALHAERVTGRTDPMASLISVEFNVMDACNRTCWFCPHGNPEAYPNQVKWKLQPNVTRVVCESLAAVDYVGRFSFSGYGEPLMNKQLERHIEIARKILPNNTIEMNTNGDALSIKRIHSLYEAGLNYLYLNVYDSVEQAFEFRALMDEAGIDHTRFRIRPHWDVQDVGLVLNNRSGAINQPDLGVAPLSEPLMGQRCHYPFYKAFVDWNGDVLFCSNDWNRVKVVGNVMQYPLPKIWMSEGMKEIRLKLAEGDRSESPCNTCDVHGTLHGETSFDLLMRHYEETADESV